MTNNSDELNLNCHCLLLYTFQEAAEVDIVLHYIYLTTALVTGYPADYVEECKKLIFEHF